MRKPPSWSRYLAALLVAVGSFPVSPPPAAGGEIMEMILGKPRSEGHTLIGHKSPPADCNVEKLGREIDWLERYIDRYGSVVPKNPDVWGQSRLTRHRNEYDKLLAEETDKFEERNNASLRRSDQSFLGLALALQSATVSGTLPPAAATTAETNSSLAVMNMIDTGTADGGKTPTFRSAPFAVNADPFSKFKIGKEDGAPFNQIGLEPTIHLDHIDRYIKHLQELRRINEGDDNSDSPGYSLNLVRIPISILPGQSTQKGHGAEITVTADLQLGDDLLPSTFRNLVINDLIDLLAPTLTYAANDPDTRLKAWNEYTGKAEVERTGIKQEIASLRRDAKEADDEAEAAVKIVQRDLLSVLPEGTNIKGLLQSNNRNTLKDITEKLQDKPNKNKEAAKSKLDFAIKTHEQLTKKLSEESMSQAAALRQKLYALSPSMITPSAQARRARLPVPVTQIPDVIGLQQVCLLVSRTYESLHNHPSNRVCIDYNDVRGLLGEELQGAYDLLRQPSLQHVWQEIGTQNLPELIRTRKFNQIERLRRDFFETLGSEDALEPATHPGNAASPCCDEPNAPCGNPTECHRICRSFTGVLAWAILVESVLLNERLIEDMHEAATAQGRMPPGGQWSGPYYGSDPSPEARKSFNEYVRLRWPIHVFALDPVVQEQNVEDMYSQQRELQIALAIAASGGRSGAQAAMRYARRLETDMATIALNKTAVAFSHGNDTFGWRFYPRFQSPPTRNNIAAFADTLIGSNSQKCDLADRRLEPGMRECTAIIVMPSFIPYVTFDVRSNWFSLNSPKKTDLSVQQTLELSRTIKAMQNSAAQCSECSGLYRDGEVARLMRRVEQLDRELPLQTMLTPIPYENTAGGFELFNTGVTDLAPELVGWYGASGIDPAGDTTLFLVGKGFSILDTTVIAGGKSVTAELISRQIMKVTIPGGVQKVRKARCPECVVQSPTLAPSAEALSASVGTSSSPRRLKSATATAKSGVVRASAEEAIAAPSPKPKTEVQTVVRSRRADADGPVLEFGSRSGEQPEQGPASPLPAPCAEAADCDQPFPQLPEGSCEDCTDGDFIDVHVASPYGVSGHLLIPVMPTDEKPADSSPPGCGLELAEGLTVKLSTSSTEKETTVTVDGLKLSSFPAFTIQASPGFIPPEKALINIAVEDCQRASEIANISINAPVFIGRKSQYMLQGDELNKFLDVLAKQVVSPYITYQLSADELREVNKYQLKFRLTGSLVAGTYESPIAREISIDVEHTIKAKPEAKSK